VDLGCTASWVCACIDGSKWQQCFFIFAGLTSIAGLATLKSLQSLNVSHNQLSAISSSLTALTHLNASHNKVTSLKAVRGCSNLRDLFLQSNKVEQAELHHLSALTALERLCLAPNPCTKALPPQQYRQAVAGLCPKLQMLDGVHVTAEERAAGSALLSSLSTQQTDVSQAPIHGLTAADITAQHAGTTRREAQASLGGSLSRRQSVGSSSSTGLSRRSSNTGLEQGQARVQAQSMLAPPRSLSLGRGNKTEGGWGSEC
jgi:Leucine-rich repeat (LRR) protein